MVIVAGVLADRQGWIFYEGSDLARYQGRRFVVASVVDGDTLDLAIGDGRRPTTRVRLWGIDTPELGRRGKAAEPFAEQATQRLAALVTTGPVQVELEAHRLRDRYGRLLAYIRLPHGEVANEVLLSEGLARFDDRWAHRHLNRYARLEEQAKNGGQGLWSAKP